MKFTNPFKKKPNPDMDECYEARRQATLNKITTSNRVIEKMEEIQKSLERRVNAVPIDFAERRRA